MADFCHLHCHTQYSLLDGAAQIHALVDRSAEFGLPALAITDHGNLYGVPEFFTKARKAGVRPIIGCEFYITLSGMQDRSDRTRYHQVLLAKTEEGYHNLMRLSSRSFMEGYYYKPRIDKATLRTHSAGLIATTCCLQGEVPQTILRHGEEAGRRVFKEWLDLFGDDYFIEIQDHGIEDQHKVNEVLLRWSREFSVKLVATNDVHYVAREDHAAQDVLLCLQTGKDLYDPGRMRFENDQFYLKSSAEMEESLHRLEPDQRAQALATTVEIADRCTFDLPMGGLLMPHFPLPPEYRDHADGYLRQLVFERAAKRYPELTQDVVDRLNYELGVIRDMGFTGYFLVVQDFTTAARRLGVRVGPGRGSAAGSLVAYCLAITDIDPLKYNLLFERFLNPERVSMPDIDIDFDDRGRARVIDYVVQKYGRENVCQIITFGTMGARSVIRDVARVLGIPLTEADRIAKLIPEGVKVSLASAIEEVPEFKKLLKDPNEQIRNLLHYAKVLEGSARHTGVHAAGVIIAPGRVSDYIPVSLAKGKSGEEDVVTTQYDGNWVEKFGLLKMDFLGLKTLTVLEDALRLIRENRGIEVDLDAIPLDDHATLDLFRRAETVAIFQFESSGMREWLRKLKPTGLEDLIAMNALYRPGPMDLIPNYIARKHGSEKVEYPHEMLLPVLEATYGLPVYQEQVMQMAQVMGGYTLGAADLLRRAMSKKKPEEMELHRSQFVTGALEREVPEKTANEVFDMIAKFAGYGFNRCVVGSTVVVDALTGARRTVEELFKTREPFTVHSLDDSLRLRPRPVTDVVWNGQKPVFELTTALSHRIRTTGNHPFRTFDGWTNLEDLSPGDRVAAQRRNLDGGTDDHGDADSDVYWDTVVSITPVGVEDTYDLTVDEHHNFVAEGLVVHNSHAAAYSVVAYQTAYLKAHYKPEFLAAAMTNDMGDTKKLAIVLEEARHLGVEVLPPSVNGSEAHFTVENGKIRFGLGAIKGLGLGAIECIVQARATKGPFKSLFDLAIAVDPRQVNRKAVESLIRAGGLDEIEGHRAQMLEALESAIQYANRVIADRAAGQNSLFGGPSGDGATSMVPQLPTVTPWPRGRALKEERDVVGFYVSGHPLEAYTPEIRAFATCQIAEAEALIGDFVPAEDAGGYGANRPTHTLFGIVTDVQHRRSKAGKPMGFATIEDFTGQAEVLCFSNVYDRVQRYLEPDEIILVRGGLEVRGGVKIIADDVIPIWKVRETMIRSVILDVEPSELEEALVSSLFELCDRNRGTAKLCFDLPMPGSNIPQRILSRSVVIEPNAEFMQGIARLFGRERVRVEG